MKKITKSPNIGNNFQRMVDIPARVQIEATIKRGAVYYFKEESFPSQESHFFVVLNHSPLSDVILVLACASSQVEKRKDIAKRLNFPDTSLVFVSPLEYGEFSKDTVFDCNSVIEKSIQTLVGKLEQGELRLCGTEMPEEIINRLIAGVLVSPQIREGTKKIIQ